MGRVTPDLLSAEVRNLYTLHPEYSLHCVRWLSLSGWAFASFSLSRPPVDFRGWAGTFPQTLATGTGSDTLTLGSPVSGPHLLNLPALSGTCSEWAGCNLTRFPLV